MSEPRELPGKFSSRLYQAQMTYYGDVFDTPPTWTRVLLGAACFVGGVMMIVHLAIGAAMIPVIITSAALILAIYLIIIVSTAAQLALVTIGFWTYLGVLVLTLP